MAYYESRFFENTWNAWDYLLAQMRKHRRVDCADPKVVDAMEFLNSRAPTLHMNSGTIHDMVSEELARRSRPANPTKVPVVRPPETRRRRPKQPRF